MIISANTSTYRKTKERHAHFRHGVAHNPENRYSVELAVDFGAHRFKPFIAHQRRITHRHHKRQMRERLIGGGTVPMLRIGGNAYGLTCLELLGLLSFNLAIAAPANSDEHLCRMVVDMPVIAASWFQDGLYGYSYRTGMPISVTNWRGSEVSPLSISVTSREKPVDFAYTE